MALATRIPIVLVLSAVSVLPLACGKKDVEGDADTLRRKSELEDIGDMYAMYAKRNQRPPKQLSDLLQKNAEVLNPAGVRALKSGDYIVVWGVSSKDSGAVLAYEKAAPTQGGLVLTADGKVQTMSADELKGKI
jgi:hypothetical protein